MTASIHVNNRTVVHKSSNGIVTVFPDVYKTSTQGGPLPFQYRYVERHGEGQ